MGLASHIYQEAKYKVIRTISNSHLKYMQRSLFSHHHSSATLAPYDSTTPVIRPSTTLILDYRPHHDGISRSNGLMSNASDAPGL